MAKERSHAEKLFSAAVLRRSFELRAGEYADGFRFVYDGVLRDLGLEDAEVRQFIAAHPDEIERALNQKG